MENVSLFLALLALGILGHLIMRRSTDIGFAIRSMLRNDRGEEGVTFTPEQQAHVDKLIGQKHAEYQGKLKPMETQLQELSKFKTEYEKSQETKTLAEQEKAKEYDLAKKGYETKIGDLSGKLTAKETEIQNIRIDHSLTNEISKQGGFTEESLAMIRGNATVDANGNIVIKTKDKNGADVVVPVADGVKQFLTERPHLVRSNHQGGSGAGGSGNGGEGGAGGDSGAGDTLESLNLKLAQALKGSDLKLRSELRTKIKAKMAEKGIHK